MALSLQLPILIKANRYYKMTLTRERAQNDGQHGRRRVDRGEESIAIDDVDTMILSSHTGSQYLPLVVQMVK